MKIYEVTNEGVADWIKDKWSKLNKPGASKAYAKAAKQTKQKNKERANTLLTSLVQTMANRGIESVKAKQLLRYFDKNGLSIPQTPEFFPDPDQEFTTNDLKPMMIKYVQFIANHVDDGLGDFDDEETSEPEDNSQQGEFQFDDPNVDNRSDVEKISRFGK